MSVAVLADVHGNLPAPRAVPAEIDTLGVDTIVVGGDVASDARHPSLPAGAAVWERNAGRA
jgi:predicted phosphodiesterase